MSPAAPSLLLRSPDRWTLAGLFVVIALSACTAPLLTVHGLTLTGDRLLGIGAIVAVAALALRRDVHWTAIHTAVAVFASIQVATSLAAVAVWPLGPRFSLVYVFGFACFALAAELGVRTRDPWRGAQLWIAIGAALGVVGTVLALIANRWQIQPWGIGTADFLTMRRGLHLVLYAAKLTFGEWNLYSSFLLVAFALALWGWQSGDEPPWRRHSGFLAVTAIVGGLVFGMTRAAWIGMAALIALWIWVRRPGWSAAGALVGVVVASFAVQAFAIGQTPLYVRVIQPVQRGQDRNITVRQIINQKTLESWRGEVSPTESEPDSRAGEGGSSRRSAPTLTSPPTSPVPPATKGPPTTESAAPATPPPPAPPRAETTPPPSAPPAVSTPTVASKPPPTIAGRWRGRLFGNGAGSINALRIQFPSERVLLKPWNGNVSLFVLHDSGAIGLASLVAIVVVVGLTARRALRRRPAGSSNRPVVVALLGAGVALLFAYQFTHALWLMYPYVYLGLLTAALHTSLSKPDSAPA